MYLPASLCRQPFSREFLGAHEALVRLARLHLGLIPAQLIQYPFISELYRLYGLVLPGFT
jgi:hypothetical protein